MLVKKIIAKDHVEHLLEMFKIPRRYKMKLNSFKCTFGVSSSKFLGYMVNYRGIETNLKKIWVIIEMKVPKRPKENPQVLREEWLP